MSQSFELERPELFTAGTVGPPGQRVFYLQGREGDRLVTLKVEKEQVGALAEYLAGLLARLPTPAQPTGVDLALIEPIAPAWAVRSLGVGYDQTRDRFVIVAEEAVEGDPDEAAAEEGASARFHVSPAQAAAFVERARGLVKAGRPPCQICGRPLNPGGHICPRSNGYGRD